MPREMGGDGALGDEFKLSGKPPAESRKTAGSDFRKIVASIARSRNSPFETFTDFVCMAACALANQTREEEYLSVAKRYSRDQLNLFAQALACLIDEMEAHPFTDILGPYYLEIGSKFSRELRGEFYSPKAIGDMMAQVLIDVDAVIEKGRPISVSDPASGSGGMILSLAERFSKATAVDLLRVTCQDISKAACDMAYVNLTLWGIPSRIIQGDTLRATVEREWLNIHWFRVGEPDRERIQQLQSFLSEGKTPSAAGQGTPIQSRPDEEGQQEWVFE